MEALIHKIWSGSFGRGSFESMQRICSLWVGRELNSFTKLVTFGVLV